MHILRKTWVRVFWTHTIGILHQDRNVLLVQLQMWLPTEHTYSVNSVTTSYAHVLCSLSACWQHCTFKQVGFSHCLLTQIPSKIFPNSHFLEQLDIIFLEQTLYCAIWQALQMQYEHILPNVQHATRQQSAWGQFSKLCPWGEQWMSEQSRLA